VGIILETSVLTAIERRSLGLERLTAGRENEPFGISAITAAELLHGIHRADSEKRRLAREAFVEKVLSLFPIYPFDLNMARIYARIWASLARKGVQIGAHDLTIASTAICLGFSVATVDLRDFGKIKGLSVERL
jgi:tRNA(fMet)-specific endonuclease VapC